MLLIVVHVWKPNSETLNHLINLALAEMGRITVVISLDSVIIVNTGYVAKFENHLQ